MDAPAIQYARTDDGSNIAWWSLGDGPPLLCLHHLSFSHPELEWAVPRIRYWLETLARRARVIRMCQRGCGLTRADLTNLDAQTLAADVVAVLDRADCERAVVFSYGAATPLAGALAPHASDRVAAFVLGAPVLDRAQDQEMTGSLRKTFPRLDGMGAFARIMVGNWKDDVEPLARLGSEAAQPEAELTWSGLYGDDLRAQLRAVDVPTLMLHWAAHPFAAAPAEIAALIPHVRVVAREGRTTQWYDEDLDSLAEIVGDFVAEQAGVESSEAGPGASSFRTLLFTDLESSTAMTQSLGDTGAQEVLRGHNDAVRGALQAHGGEEVKHTGDGNMAAFGSAVSAVRAALEIQRELAGAEVRVRVGLNAGEPIHEDDDYFGTAVQLAARVCDRAEPGQVVVTQVVRDLVRGKGFQFDDLGAATLKGFPEPERLFVVRQPE